MKIKRYTWHVVAVGIAGFDEQGSPVDGISDQWLKSVGQNRVKRDCHRYAKARLTSHRYNHVVSLRAVETIDFMTARWADLSYHFLDYVSRRIMKV